MHMIRTALIARARARCFQVGDACVAAQTRAGVTTRVASPNHLSQCGTFHAVELPVGKATGRAFTVTFDADPPCSTLRLVLMKQAAARPGLNFTAHMAGAPAKLVRGAYEVPPAGPGVKTQVTINYHLSSAAMR